MKKTGIVITSVVLLTICGSLIVLWSLYMQDASKPEQTHVVHFNDANFQKEVVEASSKMPVLVDFYADWCFPCRALEPTLEKVARDFKGRAVVGKVDTDKNMVSRRFGVNKIPAVFIIRHGEVKDLFYGVVPEEMLVKALKEFGA
jgi:thioredoxin